MNEEDKLREIIGRCLRRSKPPVKLYSKDTDGSYNQISDGMVADIEHAAEELEHGISDYLRIKEAEINSKLIQAKCDAYELALTHSRPVDEITKCEKSTPQNSTKCDFAEEEG